MCFIRVLQLLFLLLKVLKSPDSKHGSTVVCIAYYVLGDISLALLTVRLKPFVLQIVLWEIAKAAKHFVAPVHP